MASRKKVIIIGGGVAGLSAAHELVERKHDIEFDIHVYESDPEIPGGKARSLPVLNSGTEGRADLPSEHGFRFFPGFYKHLPDTMKRIPYQDQRSAFDNLVATTRLLIGSFDHPAFITISQFPRNISDIAEIMYDYFHFHDTGLTKADVEFFAGKLWQIMTSCQERRLAEYEQITWWDFVDADNHSVDYQNFLANGLARSLTANDPHKGSTRTLGDIYVQLLLNIIEPGQAADRLLNGPTNEVWIDPWLAFLQTEGVSYNLGMPAQKINMHNGNVVSVTVSDQSGTTYDIEGDYFIFAIPIEVMARLIEKDSPDGKPGPMLQADPSLAGIVELKNDVAWMNGLQYYLTEDVPIVHGHQLYVDSPWAITAVSQIQFWGTSHFDITQHGDGTVRGILSTDISNWENPGIIYGKAAQNCTKEEIAKEVWEQIKRSLNHDTEILRDDMICCWYLDPDIIDIQAGIKGNHIHEDTQPLLVNRINRWQLRPEAVTAIPNMLLASDYVKTNTDLACMEAANEAARRVVNQLLTELAPDAPLCQIWDLHEPAILAPFRWHDLKRFKQDLPWDGKLFD